MIYRYRVDCWINPRSGFDLAEFSSITKKIKKALSVLFSGSSIPERAINAFSKNHEGMVLESLIIDSDKPFKENIEEIKDKIQKRFPGSEVISYEMIEAVPVKK